MNRFQKIQLESFITNLCSWLLRTMLVKSLGLEEFLFAFGSDKIPRPRRIIITTSRRMITVNA